jgi:hypothetical protein
MPLQGAAGCPADAIAFQDDLVSHRTLMLDLPAEASFSLLLGGRPATAGEAEGML